MINDQQQVQLAEGGNIYMSVCSYEIKNETTL